MNRSAALFLAAVFVIFSALPAPGQTDYWEGTPVQLQWDRKTLESKWDARIQSFLDRGVVPLIDLESSISREDGDLYLEDALAVMDEVGVALIGFDSKEASQTDPPQTGYRWSYYSHRIVNDHPDRFILATNGGIRKKWFAEQAATYVDQLEEHVRNGDYPTTGEIEFRHYQSNNQCDQPERDINVALDSLIGRRVFALAQETNVPLVIHLEMEDVIIPVLENMLREYPNAKLVVAHFGQIRYPEIESLFGPDLVRRLLTIYPNLYFDLGSGGPNKRYQCVASRPLDMVIWQDDGLGGQLNTLKPEYQAILSQFSDRFVVGLDYGGGRDPLPDFLRRNARTVRLIMRDLPGEARHDIGYRNALFLLNGRIVTIDIKPGSFPNSINLGAGGTVPVAIFSDGDFDARSVDPATVTLSGAPVRLTAKGRPMASFEDVNGDGLLDLVVHVSTGALQLNKTDTVAVLEGKTFAGAPVKGRDKVRVVP